MSREHRTRALLLALTLSTLASPGLAQKRLQIDKLELCSYYGEPIVDDIYSFESDTEAKGFIDDILQYTGLPQNFVIQAANVPNAAAVIEQNERYILYSQSFMKAVVRHTGTQWAATSIMAHEIGHHLAGHTLDRSGSRPDTELEADTYSGHILHKMGARLEEAKAAMEAAASDRGSSTHPPKSARLAAIHNGWIRAQEQSGRGREPSSPPREDIGRQPSTPSAPAPVDLSGRWTTSSQTAVAVHRIAANRYRVQEYDGWGNLLADGILVVQGNQAAFEGLNALFVPVACRLTVQGPRRIEGQCNGVPIIFQR